MSIKTFHTTVRALRCGGIPAIHQPEPLLSKVNEDETIFYCRALFLSRICSRVTNRTMRMYSSLHNTKPPVVRLCLIENIFEAFA